MLRTARPPSLSSQLSSMFVPVPHRSTAGCPRVKLFSRTVLCSRTLCSRRHMYARVPREEGEVPQDDTGVFGESGASRLGISESQCRRRPSLAIPAAVLFLLLLLLAAAAASWPIAPPPPPPPLLPLLPPRAPQSHDSPESHSGFRSNSTPPLTPPPRLALWRAEQAAAEASAQTSPSPTSSSSSVADGPWRTLHPPPSVTGPPLLCRDGFWSRRANMTVPSFPPSLEFRALSDQMLHSLACLCPGRLRTSGGVS